jgi:hypothetical protein
LACVVATGLTAFLAYRAWHACDGTHYESPADRYRADGNLGHALIDFGGQWLMARMLVEGNGQDLYHRDAQRRVLTRAYPRSDEGPGQDPSDAERLLGWLVSVPNAGGSESALGGALYPPVQALLFAPVALLEPRPAYRVTQFLGLAMTWLAGATFAGISRGRVWWPVASSFFLVFPGYMGALYLGQNSIFSLTVLLGGWWFVTRGRPACGGAVWGLLAYKPTWAAAFFLVPLVTRRWRMAAAMLVTGTLLGLVTLPLVGIHSWLDWLAIGRVAADGYSVDENWIQLSRDLLGIPRRWLLDFQRPLVHRPNRIATAIGWGMWLAVVVTTAAVAWRRPRQVRQVVGLGAAFVGLGASLSCYHFIYYDALLAAFPVALLLTDPRAYLRPTRVAFHRDGEPTDASDGPSRTCLVNSFVLNAVALLIVIEQALAVLKLDIVLTVGALPTGGAIPNPVRFSTRQDGTPWDTFVLLALWAYSGLRTLRAARTADPPGAP